MNETLRDIANQVAVPAAPLVGQWTPVAAVPPKLRGPVPLLSTGPPGTRSVSRAVRPSARRAIHGPCGRS